MLLSHFFSRVLNQNHRIVCFCFFWHIFTRSVLKFKRWHFTLTHLASFKSGLLHFVLFSHFNYLRGKKNRYWYKSTFFYIQLEFSPLLFLLASSLLHTNIFPFLLKHQFFSPFCSLIHYLLNTTTGSNTLPPMVLFNK